VNTNENPTSAALQSVQIYTDGGCEPNPGPGGYGVVLLHPRKRAEASGGFRLTTNNRMEIFAAIAGLEMLKQPCKVNVLQVCRSDGHEMVFQGRKLRP
jgi:ribonuclease HI